MLVRPDMRVKLPVRAGHCRTLSSSARRTLLWKLRGMIGVGLTWAAVWAALGALLGVMAAIAPHVIDPGETPMMLMHAAVSFVTLTVRPEGLTGMRLLASLLVLPATMWLLLAAVGLANHWRLSRQPAQTRID